MGVVVIGKPERGCELGPAFQNLARPGIERLAKGQLARILLQNHQGLALALPVENKVVRDSAIDQP